MTIYNDISVTIILTIATFLYLIRRSKIVKLEKKMLVLGHDILNLKDDIKHLQTNYDQIQDQIDENNQEDTIQIKNQKVFHINKDDNTIIKLNETLVIGLSVIIDDLDINYNNIEKLLNSRPEQHKDRNFTYHLTRSELKKLVITAINI